MIVVRSYILKNGEKFLSRLLYYVIIINLTLEKKLRQTRRQLLKFFQCEFYQMRRAEAGSDARISLPSAASRFAVLSQSPPTSDQRTSVLHTSILLKYSVVLCAPLRIDVRSGNARYVTSFRILPVDFMWNVLVIINYVQ